MKRVLVHFILVFLGGLLFSCKPTKICPAYHSYFILDHDVTRTTFSLFGPDSLPKDPESELWLVDKKNVGIADDYSYKKKNKKMAIIDMESIYLKKKDPLDMQLAMAEMDSSTLDSLQHQRASEQYDDFYNYDQMIYLHYFGDYLPKPKPAPSMSDELKEEKTLIQDGESDETEGAEKKGFFKGLFNKKDKSNVKQSDEEPEEEDVIDEEPEGDL